MLSREQVATRLGEYYSAKFTRETGRPAEVWSYFDDQKRAYCIRGEGLPAHPDLQAQYPNGWSMIDYIKPMKARMLIVPPANRNF